MSFSTTRTARLAGVTAVLIGGLAAFVPQAAATTHPNPASTDPYSPAYGHPYRHGAVPTVAQNRKVQAYQANHSASTASTTGSKTLSYGGGIDGIGVTSGTPQVYLVFWGSQWGTQTTDGNGDANFSNDPDAGAPYIQEFFKGLGTGNETWSGTMTQYCDGPQVTTGATVCPPGAAYVGYPKGGALAGVWYDNSSKAPPQASAFQIGEEAVAAAGHFANTTPTSNRYSQYFILSPTGTNPDNYQSTSTGFCAWHDYNGDTTLDGGGAVPSPYGDIAFANMPYTMDVGAVCGQGAVNSPGTLDGYSIVAGHEYAETITDQNPSGGWTNSITTNENGDDCAWLTSGTGAMADVTLGTGTFAMQSTWSNDTNQCAMAHPLYSAMTVVSGTPQSAGVGSAYSSPLEVNVSNANGPVSNFSVTFTAPSSGPSVTFGSPCSGNRCTVTTDSSGNTPAVAVTAGSKAGTFSVTTSASYVMTLPSFSLDNLTGAPTQMSVISGSSQSAAVGSSYNSRLVVKVADGSNNGVSGVPVTFTAPATGAGATFGTCSGGNPADGCTVTTDSQGNATSSVLTANTALGSFAVTATTSGLGPQTFTLTNVVGPAALLSTVAGTGQRTLAAGGYGAPLTVEVTDQYGHPVPAVPVTFSAPASGATATFATCAAGNPTATQCVVTTDSTGTATSSAMTAGATPGSFDVQASVAGAPAVQFAETNLQSGYWTVASDGGIFNFGGAPYDGSEGAVHLNKPIVGMAAAPGGGYYLVASDGGVFALGGAPYYGSHGGSTLNKPIVGMAVTPGGGYYLVASDGGIFNYGPGATFYGSHGGSPLNKPIVGMAVTAGGGYYLVASDGGIFNYGPGATFYGSHGGSPLNRPIVGMAVTAGGGYYLVATDGGIFNYGPGATFYGSTGGMSLNKPIVGMAIDPATGGYWLDASDGGIFNFNAPFYGSMGGTPLNQPMVGMAPSAPPAG